MITNEGLPVTIPDLLNGINGADRIISFVQKNRIDDRLVSIVEDNYKQGLEVLGIYFGINPNLKEHDLYNNIDDRIFNQQYFIVKKENLEEMIYLTGLMYKITKELDDFYEKNIKVKTKNIMVHKDGIYDNKSWKFWYNTLEKSTGVIDLHINEKNKKLVLNFKEEFKLEQYKKAVEAFKKYVLHIKKLYG